MRNLLLCLALAFGGCVWESGNDQDNTGDDIVGYPAGPYGTEFGQTVENFRIETVVCHNGVGEGRAFQLGDYLGTKAMLVTVHAGWCTYCKQQASTMETDTKETYESQGLDQVLVITQDPAGKFTRQLLLDYACTYMNQFGFTFPVGIDPNGEVLSRYFDGVPLNMLLDRRMVIRYKLTGMPPDRRLLAGNIEGLLNE